MIAFIGAVKLAATAICASKRPRCEASGLSGFLAIVEEGCLNGVTSSRNLFLYHSANRAGSRRWSYDVRWPE
jgi:hypothetical protein